MNGVHNVYSCALTRNHTASRSHSSAYLFMLSLMAFQKWSANAAYMHVFTLKLNILVGMSLIFQHWFEIWCWFENSCLILSSHIACDLQRENHIRSAFSQTKPMKVFETKLYFSTNFESIHIPYYRLHLLAREGASLCTLCWVLDKFVNKQDLFGFQNPNWFVQHFN